MKLSTGIIFCFLILGVSSQRWATFLKEAGQGKDQRMGQGKDASEAPRIHLSRGHMHMSEYPCPPAEGFTWVDRERLALKAQLARLPWPWWPQERPSGNCRECFRQYSVQKGILIPA